MKQTNILHLSVNSRLAQFLKSYLIKEQLHSFKVAATPKVMTWSQVLSQWQEEQLLLGKIAMTDFPVKILSSFEAKLIWEKLLDDSSVSALLNQTEMAVNLYQAWLFFSEYLDDDLLKEQFNTEEVSLFLQLKKRYLEFLKVNNYWDASLQTEQQLAWFEESSPEYSEVHLYGFDEITPYIQRWLACLKKKGVLIKQIEQFELPQLSSMQLFVAERNMIEAQQAACWAYEQVQAGKTNIAIVAPSIDEVHQEVVWALDELMYSKQKFPLSSQQKNWQGSPLYNVSLGQPLNSFALVKHGLQLFKVLQSVHEKIDYESFSNWLISPYSSNNLSASQKLDFNLRRWQWAKISLNSLLEKMEKEDCKESFPQPLQNRLKIALKIARGGQVSCAQFVEQLFDWLKTMEWAEKVGNRTLTSHEFQQKTAFLSTLDKFKTIVISKPQQNVSQWLLLLERFLSEQIFQPKNMGASPINIMGMLEAGGQQFDGLWVMGMSSEAWAREANPNPFLPMNLQREYKIPRSDAARELAYAQTLTQRLAKSSTNIVFSYAKLVGGREQIVSPILKQFKNDLLAYQPQPYHTLTEQSFAQAKPLEKIVDDKAPVIKDGTEVLGGSGFISAQAVCPLMAFFDFRLGVKSQLEQVEEGVQKNNLGILVHRILERFWQEVKTQSKLIALGNELDKLVNQIIVEELELVKESYENHFLDIEHRRIFSLIMDWLELEKQRPSFSVINFEKDYRLDIAGLFFNIKIDRVDKVEGEHYILDYKTGKATITELTKNPLVKPQLAVYLHAPIKDIAGLGYGLIHSDEGVKFSTLSRNDSFMIKDRSQLNFEKEMAKEKSVFYDIQWQNALDYLQQEVTGLVESIKNGNAELQYEKEVDLQYAGCLLALRLPESKGV